MNIKTREYKDFSSFTIYKNVICKKEHNVEKTNYFKLEKDSKT